MGLGKTLQKLPELSKDIHIIQSCYPTFASSMLTTFKIASIYIEVEVVIFAQLASLTGDSEYLIWLLLIFMDIFLFLKGGWLIGKQLKHHS